MEDVWLGEWIAVRDGPGVAAQSNVRERTHLDLQAARLQGSH